MDKNHELKPKDIIILLADKDVTYQKHAETVRQYRKQWKTEYRNRRALKCLSFHNCRGWIYALKLIDREHALDKQAVAIDHLKHKVIGAWNFSHAKNGMYYFKVRELGRLEWFRTGRINFWIKKPATWAKVKQLLAYGFSWTGIIADQQIFELWVDTAKFKGAHMTVDTGEKLPYHKIDTLKDSNGVVVKIGDASDPTKIEIEFCYPNWGERLERLSEINAKVLEQSNKMMQSVAENLQLSTEQQKRFNDMMAGFNQQNGVSKPEAPKMPRGLYE